MIEISNAASYKLFDTLKRNLHPHSGYDSPPIFYWFRNVVEAIKLIDYGNGVKEGDYSLSLENSLGDVFYSVRYINKEVIYIITNFKFYASTIRQYIDRAKLSQQGVDLSSRPLYTSPSYKPIKMVNIGYKIICSEYQDGSIRLTYNGTPLKSQFDKMVKKFCKWRDGIYAIFEKDGVRYKLFRNDTVQRINENRQQTIRLTKAQFKRILTECITKIINEIA